MNLSQVNHLREITGCSMTLCRDALDYSQGEINLAIAYLKAKTLAVATPKLNFDERVQCFYKEVVPVEL
jgi:translation elongation factor EF-Ts